MTLSKRLLPVVIGLAALLLVAGYAFEGLWIGVVLIPIVAGCWWLAVWRQWRWPASLALVLATLAAAAGLWLGAGAEWMIAGLVLALTAWDLDQFVATVDSVDRLEDAATLERSHLGRLLVADLLGAALAVIALRLKVKFSFGIIVLLALLVVVAFGGVVRAIRRESR